MPRPDTLALLKAHAPITQVVNQVVNQVRRDQRLSDALDASLKDPTHDNIRARFLSKRVAAEYGETLRKLGDE